MPGFVFRHCYNQGFVTPITDAHGSSEDHVFTMVASLSHTPYSKPHMITSLPFFTVVPKCLDLRLNVFFHPVRYLTVTYWMILVYTSRIQS